MPAPSPSGAGREFFQEAQLSQVEARQELIREYQEAHNCRLIVMLGQIFPYGVTQFEDLLSVSDPDTDLHLLLNTPGGDGETAIRLAQQARARCKSFTVAVPDIAKSAGTLLALGADRILMGPPSDLGPVDPQISLQAGDGTYRFQPAKAIIEAVRHAEHTVQEHPETFPLQAALLGSLTAVEVQAARNVLEHAGTQLRFALRNRPDLSADERRELAGRLEERLIEEPQFHGAIISATDAEELGLPVTRLAPTDHQWQRIWQLWTRYASKIGNGQLYESERVSLIYGVQAF